MNFNHQLSIDLVAPADDVWRVIADYARDAEWREGVAMRHEPEGPVRDGTRTYEALRMLGSTHHTRATIREVVPGRSFRFVSEDGRVDGTRSVEARGSNSRVVVAIRVSPPAPMAWLAPVLGWLFRRRVERDLQRLKALVERAGAARSRALTSQGEEVSVSTGGAPGAA